jgi:hypothetical protein
MYFLICTLISLTLFFIFINFKKLKSLYTFESAVGFASFIVIIYLILSTF